MGIYGELGEGANAKVRFLQTVITREDLESITLISNIPGSEKWDVRDLFQRDVDDERVSSEIIPYLKDKSLVKYFNPITLILLPHENGRELLNNIEYIEPVENNEENIKETYESNGYYRFDIFKHEQPIGQIKWNDRKCYLVAIDGQHRLSALQRWKREQDSQFSDWKIPVIILNIYKVDRDKPTASFLEIVRKTFVYINSKAERINGAREILLNDESINALCTQELIQFAHENDIKSINQRDQSIIPLLFFDWQGKVSMKDEVETAAAVKSIEEIYSWFEEYILGEDGDDSQYSVLELLDLVPPLESINEKVIRSHEDARRIRSQFRVILLPGFLHLLQNFQPYRKYIEDCRRIERESVSRSDNAHHAFMKLRFGSHTAPRDQEPAVNAEFETLENKFRDLKKQIDQLLRLDIGMRGVIFAYGTCYYELIDNMESTMEWLEYSKYFTEYMNKLHSDGWFLGYNEISSAKKQFMTNLVFDEAGTIINYKVSQSKDALGALLVVLIFDKLYKNGIITQDDYFRIWGDYSNSLRKTYERGLRKYHKAVLQTTYKGSIPEFNAEVKRKAEVDSNKRLDKLEVYINEN